MTAETVNIIAIILGIIAVIEPFVLSYMTNKLIQKEDERAKDLIKETQKMIAEIARKTDEGNERVERILERIDRTTKEVLGEILKRV